MYQIEIISEEFPDSTFVRIHNGCIVTSARVNATEFSILEIAANLKEISIAFSNQAQINLIPV